MPSPAPASLDHLVLPVADLDVAQTRLRALGFTVAPVGTHPFGTSNCCVFLADGSFLEPLAVTDQAAVQEAIAAGNVFVSRDRLYRSCNPKDGLSAIVLGSQDAERDHSRFVKAGISAGPVLEFSRPVVDSTGKSDGATFRLAFAAEEDSPELFFFTCQRVRSPKINRAALEEHRNGVIGIRQIRLLSANPPGYLAFLNTLLRQKVGTGDQQVKFTLGGAALTIDRDAGIPGQPPALRANAIVFTCESIDVLKSLFDADGIDYESTRNSIVVRAAEGQGADFIFEANR